MNNSTNLTTSEQPPPPCHCDGAQYPHLHSEDQFLKSQPQPQPPVYHREHLHLQPHPHLQQYYHQPAHASFAPFEAGDREFLSHEGLSSDEIRQEETHVESTLQWISPLSSKQPLLPLRLEKPIIIPRLDVTGRLKAPLPFVRAYSHALEGHGIQPAAFMEFMDNLAVAQAGSAVFQTMNLAGTGVAFVPWHWAQLTGAGIQVAAGIGSTAVSVIRTKKFLAVSNERFFGPRGLKASIKKDEEVVRSLGFQSRTRGGNNEKGALAPVNVQAGCLSLRERRMAALAPYISPLTTDVPPPTQQRNILNKIAATQLQRAAKKQQKSTKKKQEEAKEKYERVKRLQGSEYGIHQDQEYHLEDFVDEGSSSDSDSSVKSIERQVERLGRKSENANQNIDSRLARSKDGAKAAELESKRSKKLAKLESEREKLEMELGKKLKERDKKVQAKNNKSEKIIQRMEYVVIENVD